MLEKLQKKNPHINIISIYNKEFSIFGAVHKGIPIGKITQFINNTPISEQDCYIPHDKSLAQLKESDYIVNNLFGQTPCNVGYFNAYNSRLNALEYHKCNEVLVLVTDVVLLLAKIDQIENNQLNSKDVVAFYAPRGSVIELYSNTLHFAPCMATSAGVRQAVFLAQYTNTPLISPVEDKNGENKYLLERNKWVLAHEEAIDLINNGAYNGIVGPNVQIYFID